MLPPIPLRARDFKPAKNRVKAQIFGVILGRKLYKTAIFFL
jgi:hypothetical protein